MKHFNVTSTSVIPTPPSVDLDPKEEDEAGGDCTYREADRAVWCGSQLYRDQTLRTPYVL